MEGFECLPHLLIGYLTELKIDPERPNQFQLERGELTTVGDSSLHHHLPDKMLQHGTAGATYY